MAVPYSELQSLAPSSLIELYEVHLVQSLHGDATVYRFHDGSNGLWDDRDIVWAGNTYQKFPVEVTGFAVAGNDQLPRPNLKIANLVGLDGNQISIMSQVLATVNLVTVNNDLTGAKFIRIRTLLRYLDDANFSEGTNPYGTADSTAEFPRDVFYIDRKVVETREYIEWELAAAYDLQGVRAPRRQCLFNICQWVYRDPETCGYSGTNYYDENNQQVETLAEDQCGKRLSSCRLRFGADNPLPFGAFPGVGSYTI